jgi:NO-binding membrane sensor protein with MHYT domain
MDTMPQMSQMSHHYNLLLVALSYVISVLGSFTALKLCRQHAGARGAGKWRSLLAGALAMGAGAIWSMHFIGMLAFDMGMPVAYDVPITLASLLVAVAVTGLGI